MFPSIVGKILQRFTASSFWPAITLCLAAFAVYVPCLDGEFLWDDHFLVGNNPFFKSPIFAVEVFRRYLFLDSFAVYYRPVQNLSYMLDYWLCGTAPFGYHCFNVLYHGLGASLLFLLLRKVLPALWPDSSTVQRSAVAFGIALVWCVHPVHNAAVAYVSGRADTLAMLFALGAWLLYFRAHSVRKQSARIALLSLAWCLTFLALCSKEIAFVWIALFAFYVVVFEREKSWKARVFYVAGVLSVIAVYAALRHAVAISDPRVQAGFTPPPICARVILMLRALGDYTGLIFYPGNLHMERVVFTSDAYRDPATWALAIRFEYLSIIGVLTLAGFAWACFSNARGREIRCFGVAWFVLGFLPISNLFPLRAEAAEHWIYMPSIGFLVLLTGAVLAMPARWQTAAIAAATLALIPLGMRTASRSAEWADPEVFYQQTMINGGFSNRVVLNLARVYSDHGKLQKAETVLREAVRRYPDFPNARINLGLNLRSQGRHAEAEEFLKFDRATSDQMAKEAPHTWAAALNVAHLRFTEKKAAEALSILDDAIARTPDIWELVSFKAEVIQETEGPAAAIAVVQPFAASRWWHYDSQLELGKLLALSGDQTGAASALDLASRLDIHASEPFGILARAELKNGRAAEAYETQLRAMKRAPEQATDYLFLAAILHELNRQPEAREALRKAEDLRTAARTAS